MKNRTLRFGGPGRSSTSLDRYGLIRPGVGSVDQADLTLVNRYRLVGLGVGSLDQADLTLVNRYRLVGPGRSYTSQQV